MFKRYWWLALPLAAVASLAIVVGNASPETGDRVATRAVRVVAAYPHDPGAFSQGLVVEGETIYEGTGQYGASLLRKYDLTSGEIQGEVALEPKYFGEGITTFGDRIYQLTWKERVCLVYDKQSLKLLGGLPYAGEGWGLTDDGTWLYLSDGSSTLQVLDPRTLRVVKRLPVKDQGRRIDKLNELEFVNGEIYANVWYSDRIARIDPADGRVLGWIDCGSVYPIRQRPNREHVLNGIAYDAASDRLFITGKHWPQLFEIEVLPR